MARHDVRVLSGEGWPVNSSDCRDLQGLKCNECISCCLRCGRSQKGHETALAALASAGRRTWVHPRLCAFGVQY